jgi:hypothetical protein
LLAGQVVVCSDSSVLVFQVSKNRFQPDPSLLRQWPFLQQAAKLFDVSSNEILTLQKDGGLGLWQTGKGFSELYVNNGLD